MAQPWIGFDNDIFDSLPLGICITDQQGLFVYVNRAYCQTYGYEARELLGKSFLTVVPEEQHEQLMALHHEFIFSNREEIPAEWRVKRKDGKLIDIAATAAPHLTAEGLRYKITTVRDISENNILKRQKEMAQRVLYHDLKSPISGIMGLAQVMELTSKLGDKERTYIRGIFDSGRRMLSMLENFLDLVKIEEGTFQFVREPLDLPYLLRNLRDQFAGMVRAKGILLDFLLQGRALDLSPDVTFWAKESLLAGVLDNLIRNALEAAPGGGRVTVEVQLGESVEISIENPGEIPVEIRDTFLEPYVTSKPQGTGLGTHSARLFVKAMGGRIDYTSEKGKTRVSVQLPIVSATGIRANPGNGPRPS